MQEHQGSRGPTARAPNQARDRWVSTADHTSRRDLYC